MAAVTPADQCEATKNRIAAGYAACIAKANSTAIVKGLTADLGDCSELFDRKWRSAEDRGEGQCPDNAATVLMNAFLAGQSGLTASIISGEQDIPDCGDGSLNVAGEHCDSTDLGGASCTSLSAGVGTLSCTPACRFDVSQCAQCPAGTYVYRNACWTLGAAMAGPDEGSCDTACNALGMTCNESLLQAVGSAGTEADCQAALDVVDPGGAPWGISAYSPEDHTDCGLASDYAVGCSRVIKPNPSYTGSIRFTHDLGATSCSADFNGGSCLLEAGIKRVCACTP
jgi:hypothetical protein